MSFISYWTREIRPGHGFILGLNVYTTLYIYRQVQNITRVMRVILSTLGITNVLFANFCVFCSKGYAGVFH